MVLFGRVATAMVTPFDNKGNIDFSKVTKLVNYLIDNGTDSLVVSGTTGESPTLTKEEKIALFKHVVKVVDKRIPVIAGTGSYDTYSSIELTKKAEEAGVDGIMLVAPYYNKPNQRGLYEHYAAIARAVTLPIIIYNIPPRSVIDMTPETMGRLHADFKNIVGVKDATAKVDRVTEQRLTCGPDFIQLSGEDASALGFNAHGGVGCISVTANAAPRLCAEFQEASLSGDREKALQLQDRLMPLHKALFIEPNPAGVKYALSRLGKMENVLRNPLVTVEQETADRIDAALQHAGLLN